MSIKNNRKIKTIIDIVQAMASRLLIYYSLWGLINGTGFSNWFCAKYLRLQLLHHPFALQKLDVIALLYVIY